MTGTSLKMIRSASLAALLLVLVTETSSSAQFNYELCRVVDLIAEIESAIPPKSQFENDAAYQKRRENAVADKIPVGRLKNVACEIARRVGSNSWLRYDPEAGNLFLMGGLSETRITSTTSKELRTYPAQNAFGAIREVQVVETESFGIAWIEGERFGGSGKDYRLKMARERAEQLSASLTAVVVGDIVHPFAKLITHSFGPTFSSPREETTKTHYLVISPKQLILFDDKTREIIRSESIVWCRDVGWGGEHHIGKCPTADVKSPGKLGR